MMGRSWEVSLRRNMVKGMTDTWMDEKRANVEYRIICARASRAARRNRRCVNFFKDRKLAKALPARLLCPTAVATANTP